MTDSTMPAQTPAAPAAAPAPLDLRSSEAQERLTLLAGRLELLRDLGSMRPAKPDRPTHRITLAALADYQDARAPLRAWKADMAERAAEIRALTLELRLPLHVEIEAVNPDGEPVLIVGAEMGRDPLPRWRVLPWYDLGYADQN